MRMRSGRVWPISAGVRPFRPSHSYRTSPRTALPPDSILPANESELAVICAPCVAMAKILAEVRCDDVCTARNLPMQSFLRTQRYAVANDCERYPRAKMVARHDCVDRCLLMRWGRARGGLPVQYEHQLVDFSRAPAILPLALKKNNLHELVL